MASQTIPTRILIISDTHCASLDGVPGSGFKRPLPPADLLIHCGDLTHRGRTEEYHKCLDMLQEIDAPVKLVIAGNHDCTLDRDFMLGHLREFGPVRETAEESFREMRTLWTAKDGRAKREGVTFLDEGTHTIELPHGASVKVYASPYTPEFCDWSFPYEKYEDRYNDPPASLSDATNIASNPIPSFTHAERPLDILITHGPPYERLDETTNGELPGCPHLLRALMRARPLVHCFGHIHEGRGAERVQWAESASEVAAKASSTAAWKNGGYEKGIRDVKFETQGWGFGDEQQDHTAVVDGSSKGQRPLLRGEETVSWADGKVVRNMIADVSTKLLVNASIMNVRYRPVNAPWLLYLDLPVSATEW